MMPSQQLTLDRFNQLERHDEQWHVPSFNAVNSRKDRFIFFLRRLLDFQAASKYTDLKILLPQTSGNVLDVGCGAQPYRHLFPDHAVYQAIDHATAESDFGYKTPDTIYYSGDQWPVPDRSQNFILSTETLEHVDEPVHFLKEAERVLKPTGQIILTVPFAARWHYIPHDYWRFTPSGLALSLQKAGFDDIREYCRGNHLTIAAYKVLALFLTALFPAKPSFFRRLFSVALMLMLTPILMSLSFVGHLSLRCKTADDTLGYTVIATRL